MSVVESERIVSGLNQIIDRLSLGRMLYVSRGILIASLLCAVIFLITLNILSYLDVNHHIIRKMLFAGCGISVVILLGFTSLSLVRFSGRRLFRLIKLYNTTLYSHTLAVYELMHSRERFSRDLYLDYVKKVEEEISTFAFGRYIFSKQVKIVIVSLFGVLLIVSLVSLLHYRTLGSVSLIPKEKGVEGPGIIVDIGKVRREIFFPSYTGMESISNYDSSRLIEVLKGSMLRITVENVVGAREAYLVYENTRVRMEKKGGRFVGDISLVQSGHMRVDFTKSGIRYSSSDFKIKIVKDDNPEIFLSAPEDILRGSTDALPDRKIEISYTASDDYGVRSVNMVVSLPDGKEKIFGIKEIVPPRKEISSEYVWDYSELAKYVQGELMFALEAEDNDTVSGPKRQRTRFYRIVVPRGSESFIKEISLLKGVRSGMLRLLSLDLTYTDISRYITDRSKGYVEREILKKIKEYQNVLAEKGSVYKELAKIMEEVSFHNRRINLVIKQYMNQKDGDYRSVLAGLTREETIMLERNILVLQDIMDEVVYMALLGLSKEISSLRKELRSLVDKYETTKNEEIRLQIMALISLLEERLKEYGRIQSELVSSFSDVNINKKAMEDLSYNIGDMVKSVTGLKERFRKDEMQGFRDHLKNIEEMMGDIENNLSNMLVGLDRERYRELVETMGRMSDEIMEIIDEQRRVSSDLSVIEADLKRRYYDAIKERLNNLLKGIIEDATRLREDISKNAHIVLRQTGPMNEYASLVQVETIISQMIEQLKQRQVFDSLLLANNMVEKLEWINNVSKIFSANGGYQDLTAGFYKRGVAIRDRIKAIIEGSRSSLSQSEKGRVNELMKREEEIKRRISELSRNADNLSSQLGNAFDRLSSNLREASQSSARAVSAMGNDNIPLARSNTDDSISRLDDALKEISRLKSGRMKMLSQEDGGEEGGGERRFRTAEVRFPKKEDFKPDERLREEIMKALQDEEVKGYEEVIRRYYEEIIK